MKSLTIAGLARAGDVGVETVRYYQRRGLLPSPVRTAVTRTVWRYGDEDVRRLRFIRAAQASGFTLDQIKELIALDGSNDRKRAQAIASARIRELDEKILAMTEARGTLLDLLDRCKSGRGPCPIIPALNPGPDVKKSAGAKRV